MRKSHVFAGLLLLGSATLFLSAEARAGGRADRRNSRLVSETIWARNQLALGRQRMKTGVFGLTVKGGKWELSQEMAAEARRVADRGNGQTIIVPRGSALGRALANLGDGRLPRVTKSGTTPVVTVERWNDDVRVTLMRRPARGREAEPDVFHIGPDGLTQYVAIPPRTTRTGVSPSGNSRAR